MRNLTAPLSHVDIFVSPDHSGRSLLHSPPSQRQTRDISDGPRHPEHKSLQAHSVLFAETHSQGEGVGLGVVEGLAEGHQVELDQHPPQGEGLVGQPADEKGEHDDGDGAGNFGAPAPASPLALRSVGGVGRAAHDAPAQDEPQQEEVAHGNDDQRDQESQQDFLHLIKSEQHLRVPLVRIRVGEAHEAQLVVRRHL